MALFDTPSGSRVEVVRGRLGGRRAAQLVAFWTGAGLLGEDAARERLGEAVCVLVDEHDEVAGVNTVFAADVPLIGGRRFWIYHCALREPGAWQEMLATAFRALDATYDPRSGGPVGLCLLVDDAGLLRARPEAEWAEPRLVYAGYLADGRQVRIGYFADAPIGPGL